MNENEINTNEVTEVEENATPVVEEKQGFTTAEKAAGIGILACVLFTGYNGGKWIAGKIKKGVSALKEKAAAKKNAAEETAPVEEQAETPVEGEETKK